MYRVYLFIDGCWMEWSKYETSPDMWDCVEAMGTEREIRITGPDGEWTKPKDSNEYKFVPYKIQLSN